MRVFTIRVLFAGLLEASTQAYGFSWRMSTILWSVRFCHHFWNICWIHTLLVVPPSLFVIVFNGHFRWGVTPCLEATKIRWAIDFRPWDTPWHQYTTSPTHPLVLFVRYHFTTIFSPVGKKLSPSSAKANPCSTASRWNVKTVDLYLNFFTTYCKWGEIMAFFIWIKGNFVGIDENCVQVGDKVELSAPAGEFTLQKGPQPRVCFML